MAEANDRGKILVTGGTGFVGSHLVDRLVERGKRVRCLVRSSSNLRYLKPAQIEIVYGGLDDSTDWDEALRDVETIYHVAGLTFARRRQDYFKVNHQGTEAIIAATVPRRNQIKKFIQISSLAAIGPGQGNRPVNEDTTPQPVTAYGRSKLMGEEAVTAVADLIPVTIVRPPAVYGPRDYALYELFKTMARGLSPMIGNYDKQISLVHVRDLVDGIILAGESKTSTGRAYFISSDEVYSWLSVADLVAKVIGRPLRKIAIPRNIAYGLAVVAEGLAAVTGKPPVINRDKVTDLSQTCWGCSIERARSELGYSQRVPLEEGLRETISWYRGEGWL